MNRFGQISAKINYSELREDNHSVVWELFDICVLYLYSELGFYLDGFVAVSCKNP